jgi:acetamidase/formamidase
MLHFPPDFVIPIRPMVGIVQVAPRINHPGGAWNHGGNLDLNSVQAGSTVYIRAQRYKALLTIGDTHAYQGDGELTGTGVEIDTTVTIKVERGPDFPNGGVVVETADKWYATGVATDWEGALKIAWTEAVALVEYLHDTSAEHANRIVGTIGDTLPGYAAGQLNNRGFTNENAYVTLQIGIPKSLKRTGKPFQP